MQNWTSIYTDIHPHFYGYYENVFLGGGLPTLEHLFCPPAHFNHCDLTSIYW